MLVAMKRTTRPVITAEQQLVLEQATLRRIEPGEQPRFNSLIVEQHYLHSIHLVGERLCYVAEHQGQWIALMAWSAAAFKLKQRETWIGWSDKQKQRRLPLVVNQNRFLILNGFHVPNLGSRLLRLCLDRLSADWRSAYGHEVLVAESFVDGEEHFGTCYKASNWELLGQTQGYQRARQDFYVAHERPKQLWMRELRPGARTILRGRNLPEALRAVEAKHPPQCPQTPETLRGMRTFFAELPDWRTGDTDFEVSTLAAVTLCALLGKVCLGQRDLFAFAEDLTRAQKEALGFPRDHKKRGRPYRTPSETTFFRFLSEADSLALERELLKWQDVVLGPRDSCADRVAVDGKELLNSQGLEIASAYSVRDGRWLGSELDPPGSNEIPAVQTLLRRVEIEGSLVTADALNTQTETARIIVQERGADYLLPVKGNQKGVCKNVQQLYRGLKHVFSPSGHDANLAANRTQPRPVGNPLPAGL